MDALYSPPLPSVNISTDHPPTQYKIITRNDIDKGGKCLVSLTVLFILINLYLAWLTFKSWKTIRKSRFFNTDMLCLLLTLSDFLLALFVGLPAGLHLTWASYFRHNKGMMFYNKYIGYIMFEYLFLLRVVIIAVLATDRCIHVMKPLRYDRLVTSQRLRWINIAVFSIPLVVRAFLTSSIWC